MASFLSILACKELTNFCVSSGSVDSTLTTAKTTVLIASISTRVLYATSANEASMSLCSCVNSMSNPFVKLIGVRTINVAKRATHQALIACNKRMQASKGGFVGGCEGVRFAHVVYFFAPQ